MTDYTYSVMRDINFGWTYTVGFDEGRGHIRTGRAFSKKNAHSRAQAIIAVCVMGDLRRAQYRTGEDIMVHYEIEIR